MSDEPRRSVRSTKGIHSHKEQEIEGNLENQKKKANTKKTANKKNAAPSREPSPAYEKNADGDIIRCVCGAKSQDDDDDGEPWVCCEQCETWEHNVCMGVPTEDLESLPDYFCEQCRPENHQELLAAIDRGEKLWEERRRIHEAGKKARKNRKGKGGGTKKKKADSKPTAQHANGQANKESPVPSGRETPMNAKGGGVNRSGSAKRNREESQDQDSGKIKQRKVSSASAAPLTPATVASQAAFATPVPAPPAAPLTDLQVPKYTTPSDLPSAIDDLNGDRKKIARLVYNRMEEAVKVAADSGLFTASPDNSIEQKALRLTLELERAIHDAYPIETSKPSYINQGKLVGNNIKINQELCDKLLSHELSIGQLAVMSQDDMKSSKLRQQDEEVVARAERQSIMVTADDGPRIRRTHKGEELVEDNFGANSAVPSREQRDPNGRMAVRSRENTPDELIELPFDADYAARPKQPLNINTQAGTHERKLSAQASEFDYNKVVSKLPTPTHTQPNRRASGPVPIAREAVDDPDVDRMLEDGPESPPYSPKEDSDPSVIWSGEVAMSAISTFDASAKHVGGVDLNEFANGPSYLELLGEKLTVTGRIEPEKADDYLCGLRYSPGSDIIVISITPCGELSTAEFTKVFDYFVEKGRYGVIGARMGPSQVRDVYLIPIEAGNGGIPTFMSNIEVNKLPENRLERSMLVVIVYRAETAGDGNQSPSLMNHPQRLISNASGPAMSPLTQQGSFMSPVEPSQQQLLEAQRQGEILANDILGPELIRSPTVAFILPQAHKMVPKEWNVIKEIFTNDPKARTDLQYLGQLLAERANQTDQQQQ